MKKLILSTLLTMCLLGGNKSLSPNQVIEYTETYDNVHIVNSYLITNEKIMKDFIKEHCNLKYRSVNSYYCEWKAHNTLYELGIERDRTKDADLDIYESKLRLFGYYIIALF